MRFTVRMTDYNIDWVKYYWYQRKQYKKARYRKAEKRIINQIMKFCDRKGGEQE